MGGATRARVAPPSYLPGPLSQHPHNNEVKHGSEDEDTHP